jgi:hypothetical protein
MLVPEKKKKKLCIYATPALLRRFFHHKKESTVGIEGVIVGIIRDELVINSLLK